MTLSNEERSVSVMLSNPGIPTACVEGDFKGERAVFVCLIDYHDPKNPQAGYDVTPLARLLTGDDLKHVRGHEGQSLGAAPEKKLIKSGEGGA